MNSYAIPNYNPKEYQKRIIASTSYIKNKIGTSFTPIFALTLGSGGLENISEKVKEIAKPIPYSEIPYFPQTSIAGHEGSLIAGTIHEIPVIVFKGRTHYYEIGPNPDSISALRYITIPIYVSKMLGASIYFGTNAAGALNNSYKTGDIMIISSHIDLFFPNPLLGPLPNLFNESRFLPQHTQYNEQLKTQLLQSAKNIHENTHVHQGFLVSVTGPTYESRADSLLLKSLGADAVGMSLIPEVIVASHVGMETMGISLITNLIQKDGTNMTDHNEVMQTLQNPAVKSRLHNLIFEFFRQFK